MQKISREQIQQLELQGNFCDNWSQVHFNSNLNLTRIRNCQFVGTFFCSAEKSIELHHAHLNNVQMGEDNRIFSSFLENVSLGYKNDLRNNHYIGCKTEHRAGEHHPVKVLDETGTKSLITLKNWSSQTAAFLLSDLIDTEQKERLFKQEQKNEAHKVCIIGNHCLLENNGHLERFHFTDFVHCIGVRHLHDCSVVSTEEEKTRVYYADHLSKAIIQRQSFIGHGCIVQNSLIGQAVHLDNQASITHSFIFSNSEIEHSEVVSSFLGPFSVSHHRASLLIATMANHFNAGSGTQFSNHHYRGGPLHFGQFDKGCKIGSIAYAIHPSTMAAYSTLLGKHGFIDSRDFPFSIVRERDGKTQVIPGSNFYSYGLYRDINKWQERDRRLGKKDDATFNELLSPSICQTLERSVIKYSETKSAAGVADALLKRGIKTYEHALRLAALKSPLKAEKSYSEWTELAGFPFPLAELKSLSQKNPASIKEINQDLEKMIEKIQSHKWQYKFQNEALLQLLSKDQKEKAKLYEIERQVWMDKIKADLKKEDAYIEKGHGFLKIS